MAEVFHLDGKYHFIFSKENYNIKSIKDIDNIDVQRYNCHIPGNFELDLYENNIIPDPYFGTNIKIVQEYEKNHVWYFRKFDFNKEININYNLILEGIDCFSDIFINGNKVLSTNNMLIPYQINISAHLTSGHNEILIHISPTVLEAKKYQYTFLESTFKSNMQSLHIRKAPHMFGWDILPRIVSAGIFKSIYIVSEEKEGFNEIYLAVNKIENNIAYITFFYNLRINDKSDNIQLLLEANCENSTFTEKIPVFFNVDKYIFTINNPKLWWPHGRGNQNMYNCHLTLLINNKVIAKKTINLGIKTSFLKRTSLTDDNSKGEFVFIINNEKVFIKGTNWVALDAFHSRDKEKISKTLKYVKDLNCNMVRCWGGNLYEDNLFYNLCDEMGILVWQDFAMACAIYPQTLEFQKEIETEATSVVKRLRQHPCVTLWAGDNECDQAYSWFGFTENPNKNILTRKVIPNVLRNHDPFRSYLPSSPYIDDVAFETGDKYLTENHLWGPRGYYKDEYYAKAVCHFASEIGYHGCPSVDSIKKFISTDCLWPFDNEEWLLHSTSPIPQMDDRYDFRVSLMANQVKILFGSIPDTLDDFSFFSQISQAEAKKFFIELFRINKWNKTGLIWWNLIDGWPQFSDAIIDWYHNKKIAYEYIKRSQQDICVFIDEPKNNYHEIILSNDTRFSKNIKVCITDLDTGKVLFSKKVTAIKDKFISIGKIEYIKAQQHFYYIKWDNGYNHYLSGNPPFNFDWYKAMYKKL